MCTKSSIGDSRPANAHGSSLTLSDYIQKIRSFCYSCMVLLSFWPVFMLVHGSPHPVVTPYAPLRSKFDEGEYIM